MWTQDQQFLLAPSFQDLLPEGHLAWNELDVVSPMDISLNSYANEAKEARGQRLYNLQMMVALLLYAYCSGVFSSCRIVLATYTERIQIQNGLTVVLGYSFQTLAGRLILSSVSFCASRCPELVAESSC